MFNKAPFNKTRFNASYVYGILINVSGEEILVKSNLSSSILNKNSNLSSIIQAKSVIIKLKLHNDVSLGTSNISAISFTDLILHTNQKVDISGVINAQSNIDLSLSKLISLNSNINVTSFIDLIINDFKYGEAIKLNGIYDKNIIINGNNIFDNLIQNKSGVFDSSYLLNGIGQFEVIELNGQYILNINLNGKVGGQYVFG